MAGRIRTLKPEWLEDEKLAAASDAARLLSVVLLLTADDHGNGRAGLSHLASAGWGAHVTRAIEENSGDAREVFRRISGALGELVSLHFIVLYEVRGQAYFSIRNWQKHQNVQKPGKPRVPKPEEADPPSAAPPDPPPDGPPSGDPPETLRPDLRPPTTDLRPPTADRDARARDPDHRPDDPRPPTDRSAAAVVVLDERRGAPADLGEAHTQALRMLERGLGAHGLVTPLPPGEYTATREAATWVWQRVDGDGEAWRRAFTAIVERWASSVWVQRNRPQRPGGNLRSQLARLWDDVHGTGPAPASAEPVPCPQLLSQQGESRLEAELCEAATLRAFVAAGIREEGDARLSTVEELQRLDRATQAAIEREARAGVEAEQARRRTLVEAWRREHEHGRAS